MSNVNSYYYEIPKYQLLVFRKKDPVTEHLNIFQTSIEYIILNNIDRVVQKIFISDGSVIYAEEILRLSNYFNKVDIIRPEGRNIGTTEAYLICTGFRAFQITRDKNWLIVMHKNMCKEIMSELNSRKFVERKFKEIVTVTSGTKEIRQVERMEEVKRYWNEEIKLLKALGTKTWIETGTPPLKRKKMREEIYSNFNHYIVKKERNSLFQFFSFAVKHTNTSDKRNHTPPLPQSSTLHQQIQQKIKNHFEITNKFFKLCELLDEYEVITINDITCKTLLFEMNYKKKNVFCATCMVTDHN